MFHLKIHNQKILTLANSLFSLPQSELIFFPSWAIAALHPFCLLLCQVSQPEDTFFPWHVITMQLLCPVGRLYFAVQKQLHSPVYKRPKLEIRWDPPAAQRDTAYPKQKHSVCFESDAFSLHELNLAFNEVLHLILLMEDFSFQLKLKHFRAKISAVWFCSPDQVPSKTLLVFVCMACNWEIPLL